MKCFLYYKNSVGKLEPEDVAVVYATSLRKARKILRKYYTNVEKIHIHELNFRNNHKSNVINNRIEKNMTIYSDY